MAGSLEELSRIVKLNVGGRTFQTSRDTLVKWSNPKLEALFRGDCPDAMQDEDGSWFIDRDGDHFRHILAFMRAGTLNFEDFSPRELKMIAVDADFFGIDALKVICADQANESRHEQWSVSQPGSPRAFTRSRDPLEGASSPALAGVTAAGSKGFTSTPIVAAGSVLSNRDQGEVDVEDTGKRGIRLSHSLLLSDKPNIVIFQRAAEPGAENLVVVDGETLHSVRHLHVPMDTFAGECGILRCRDPGSVLVFSSSMADALNMALVDWARGAVRRTQTWSCARVCAEALDDGHVGLGLIRDERGATHVLAQSLDSETFQPATEREFVPSLPVRRSWGGATMVPRLWITPKGRVLVCCYLEGGRLEAWVWDWQGNTVAEHALLQQQPHAPLTNIMPVATNDTFLVCSQEKSKELLFWNYRNGTLASYTRRAVGTKWIQIGSSHMAFFDKGEAGIASVVDLLTGSVVAATEPLQGLRIIDCCGLHDHRMAVLSALEGDGNRLVIIDFLSGEVLRRVDRKELRYKDRDKLVLLDSDHFMVLPRNNHGCRPRVFNSNSCSEVSRWDALDGPWGSLAPVHGTSHAIGLFLEHLRLKGAEARVVLVDYLRGSELQSFPSSMQVAFKALPSGRSPSSPPV